jgi:hypothetical protein
VLYQSVSVHVEALIILMFMSLLHHVVSLSLFFATLLRLRDKKKNILGIVGLVHGVFVNLF